MTRVSLTAVIVTHDSLRDLRRSLPALAAQLGPDDELIVVDNASSDGIVDEIAGIAPRARLVPSRVNLGFAAGANAGAREAGGDLIVVLNPDVIVEAGWSDAIRAPWGGEWAAWMGLVTLDGGREINTSGGVLHFTALGWAGQMGRPVADAPQEPAEVGFLSGACLAMPLTTWHRLGGFAEEFFMYCEDVDLSLRLRLLGGKLAVIPAARVTHDYEFDKGQFKWRLLERNRWATIVRTYPGPLLLAVAPALAVTELAIWVLATRGRWASMKALATRDFVRRLPSLLRQRRTIRADGVITAAEFARALTPELDSPYFGALGRSRSARVLLSVYWGAVTAVLGAWS
jgi:N-acetylglucosaminyl-diphospho-decaprenol L-rhamnosyltransferase